MSKVILTDCDGVLLDWETAFYDWMKSIGYDVENEGVYDMARVFAMEKTSIKRLIREFNNSAWMGFLKPLRDARSGVARLAEAGYEFHCITSLSLDPNTKQLRQQNLDNVFGKGVFSELICLDTGADKDDVLSQYALSELYWLEDKIENAECGKKFGLKPILISHEHNKEAENITRLDTWKDIADHILEA